MGVYTFVDKPLGLTITPRMEDILNDMRLGNEISHSDICYLIDDAARFETINTRIRKGNYLLTDSRLSDAIIEGKYGLDDVLGNLVDELYQLEAHKIGQDSVYYHQLNIFPPYQSIESASADRIEAEIRSAVQIVKDMQKNFDEQEKVLTAVGIFSELKRHYGVNVEVRADSNKDEVVKEVVHQVQTWIQRETQTKEKALKELGKI